MVVAVVADVAGHERIEKLKRPIVQREAQDAHVVGVHHPVAKTHGLPLGHELCGALTHAVQQCCVGVAAPGAGGLGAAAFGVIAVDDVVGQCAQLLFLVVGRKVLKVAKAHKARGHAGDDGGGFQLLTPHQPRRARDAQSPRCGNAQAVHGLAAQEFADAGAQNSPPIAHAGIGRAASALELDFVPASQFAQQNGPAVAQLACPHAELVAAVHAGQRGRACQHLVACERLQGFFTLMPPLGQPQQLRHRMAGSHPVGGWQGSGAQLGVEVASQRGKAFLPWQRQRRRRGAGGGKTHAALSRSRQIPPSSGAMSRG